MVNLDVAEKSTHLMGPIFVQNVMDVDQHVTDIFYVCTKLMNPIQLRLLYMISFKIKIKTYFIWFSDQDVQEIQELWHQRSQQFFQLIYAI